MLRIFVIFIYCLTVHASYPSVNQEEKLKSKLWNLFYNVKDLNKCYLKAKKHSQHKSPTAYFFMGKVLEANGETHKAIKYYKLAARKNHQGALVNIGLYYAKKGTDKSTTRAIRYYKKAIKLGNILAVNNMGALYCDIREYDKAEFYSLKAFNSGLIYGALNLADIYLDDNNPKKNHIESVKYFTIAKSIIKDNHDIVPNAKLSATQYLERKSKEIHMKVKENDIIAGKRKAKQWLAVNSNNSFLTITDIERNNL